jgi:hypothetical protein
MFLFQNKLAHGSFKDINNSLYGTEIFVIPLQTNNLYVGEQQFRETWLLILNTLYPKNPFTSPFCLPA